MLFKLMTKKTWKKTVVLLSVTSALVMSGLSLRSNVSAEETPTDSETLSANSGSEVRILDNVSVGGIKLSGMTLDEARTAVGSETAGYRATPVKLTSSYGDVDTTLEAIGYTDNSETAVIAAGDIGNTGDILKRYKDRKNVGSEAIDLPLQIQVDKVKLEEVVQAVIGDKINVTKTYSVNDAGDGKVKITASDTNKSMDADAVVNEINDILNNNWDKQAITVDMKIGDSDSDDGISNITDLLGEFTTNYYSAAGRMKNVERAAELINGTVVKPGETFSALAHIYPFTPDNGYSLATVFAGSRMAEDYGGGVCQVSSTLYNAVLKSELSIVERHYHGMTVHYVDLSYDAAISGQTADFKFTNNLENPIYIQMTAAGGYLTAKVYGKEYRPANRTIEFFNKTIATIQPGDPEYVVDPEKAAPGQAILQQSAKTGYVAELWKNVYIDGVLKETIKINESTYTATPAYYAVYSSEYLPDADGNIPTATEDTTETTDTTSEDTTQADTQDTTQADTTDTTQPDTTQPTSEEPVQPDTTDTTSEEPVQPDTTEPAVPDSPDPNVPSGY